MAIMLKILDAKCKMGETDKAALTAVYDVVKGQAGQQFDETVHTLIADARCRMEAGLVERIHAMRLRADAAISKLTMKEFKQLLRSSMRKI